MTDQNPQNPVFITIDMGTYSEFIRIDQILRAKKNPMGSLTLYLKENQSLHLDPKYNAAEIKKILGLIKATGGGGHQ